MKKLAFIFIASLVCISTHANEGSAILKDHSSEGPSLIPQTIHLSNGINLEHIEKGKLTGPTIIFLHGYSDSWHSFEYVLKYFPDDVHLIAITLRGHGNSSKPKSNYHPKDFAKDVAQFIKEKKLGTCIIVGHSMGGVVSQQFVIDYPDLTKALILVNTDAKLSDNPGVPEFVANILKLEKPINRAFAKDFQLSTLAKPIDSVQLERFTDESLKLPLYVWKAIAKGLMEVDFTNDLKKVIKPALVLCGDKDSFISMTDQDNLAGCLKNSKLLVYENTGHALHWEEPKRFADDVMKFVSKLSEL